MKTKRLITAVLCLGLCIAFSTACNHENMSRVTLYFGINDQAINVPQNGFFNKIVSFFIKEAVAKGKTWTADYERVTLTVTGESMDEIITPLPTHVSSYTIEVPAGSSRAFTIIAYGSNGLRKWGGQVISNIDPGDVNLTLRIFPIPGIIIDDFMLPDVRCNIDHITSSTVHTGDYNLYRSTSYYGPYIKIYSGPIYNVLDDDCVYGITYHYKASINTIYGEGQLSDTFSYTYTYIP